LIQAPQASGLFYNFYLWIKIFLSGYTWALSLETSEFTHLAYACRKSAIMINGRFINLNRNLKNTYKLVAAFLSGILASPFITIKVFLASFRYLDKT